jgi:hypothetical protein
MRLAFTALPLFLLASVRPAGALQQPPQRSVVRDSTPGAATAPRRLGQRRAVTADLLRTAFADDAARSLYRRAQQARLSQDSLLRSYAATGRERVTARAGIGEHGIDRTIFRRESIYDVAWSAGVGARVEMKGERVGMPLAPAGAEHDEIEESVTNAGVSPIPYFPGADPLAMSGTARPDVNDAGRVDPLATGAEAYYTYATGDSLSFTLPGGVRTQLRELRVRPREPLWNLVVGSLWFEVSTGQLVRGAFRYAAPRDLIVTIGDRARDNARGNPLLLKLFAAIASPLRTEISGVVTEYGLYGGRFWLPRIRSVDASARVSFTRVAVTVEQAFTYESINGPEIVPRVALNDPTPLPVDPPDSLTPAQARRWRDSTRALRRQVRAAFTDSLQRAPCDSTGKRVVGRRRGRDSSAVAVAVVYPCNVDALTRSPEFTTPLYAPDEAVFGAADRDALLASALPLGAQAALALGALPRPSAQYGLSMTRFNRIEGLSTGARVEQQLGAGYAAALTARLGTADLEPNVELSLARANAAESIAVGAYNRLVSANDWGYPLSFGSSVSALLFGRDDGFYYRASGAELRWTTTTAARLDWRAFGEQQRTAQQRIDAPLGGTFEPNIVARVGGYGGLGVHWQRTTGIDPRGFRTLSDVRLETATGSATYARAAFDVTLSTGLPQQLAASLTLASGASAGSLPPQRRWFLGSAETIRGEPPDTARSGNAFWMARAELGRDFRGVRLATFADVGWVGDRSAWRNVGRPMSDVGVGLSVLDGLVRFDVARGLAPLAGTRVLGYVNARF